MIHFVLITAIIFLNDSKSNSKTKKKRQAIHSCSEVEKHINTHNTEGEREREKTQSILTVLFQATIAVNGIINININIDKIIVIILTTAYIRITILFEASSDYILLSEINILFIGFAVVFFLISKSIAICLFCLRLKFYQSNNDKRHHHHRHHHCCSS